MSGDVVRSRGPTRRGMCAGAVAVILLGVAPGRAAGGKTTRLAAWAIGSNLAMAAMVYAKGGEADLVDRFLNKAKAVAQSKEIGIEIKPFPPPQAVQSQTIVAVAKYLITGPGKVIGQTLTDKFDADHGRLYEVAVKSMLLVVLYDPATGDDFGTAGIIKDRCQALGLPPDLWKPVTDAIAAKRDGRAVNDAVLTMHQKVFDYLLKNSR